MMDAQALYAEAEDENTRLRAIIRWCAPRLPVDDHPTLQKMFDDDAFPDATDELEADLQRARRLALGLADLVEPVLQTRKVPRGWNAKAAALLGQARGFKPTNPILRLLPEHSTE